MAGVFQSDRERVQEEPEITAAIRAVEVQKASDRIQLICLMGMDKGLILQGSNMCRSNISNRYKQKALLFRYVYDFEKVDDLDKNEIVNKLSF